jgi:enolase
MTKIRKISFYQIYNGSGRPALAVKLWLKDDIKVFASRSLGVHKFKIEEVVNKLKEVAVPWLLDLDLEIDSGLTCDMWLQDHQDKWPLSVSLLISLAVNRAVAKTNNTEFYEHLNKAYGLKEAIYVLPTPLFNMFNGGAHADTNLDFEEFLLVPLSKNQKDFAQKVSDAVMVYHELGKELKTAGFDTDVGIFGGYAPDMVSSIQAIELIMSACQEAGFTWTKDFGLGVDVGAKHLSSGRGNYLFKLDHSQITGTNLLQVYEDWRRDYHLVYLEDPLAPSDNTNWRALTQELGDKVVLAGDELFAGSEAKFRQNLKDLSANTVVVKLSQMASLGEAIALIKLAHEHNYQIVLASDDEETEDNLLADLAVATSAEYIKAGSLARSERVAKLNRLIEIEQDLAS